MILLAFWMLPPWGLWMLYRDTKLSVTAKFRVLLYALVIPVLALLAYTFWGTNKALSGLGF